MFWHCFDHRLLKVRTASSYTRYVYFLFFACVNDRHWDYPEDNNSLPGLNTCTYVRIYMQTRGYFMLYMYVSMLAQLFRGNL